MHHLSRKKVLQRIKCKLLALSNKQMCMIENLHLFKKNTIVLQRIQQKLPPLSKKQMCI
jgi:hypothetical protein